MELRFGGGEQRRTMNDLRAIMHEVAQLIAQYEEHLQGRATPLASPLDALRQDPATLLASPLEALSSAVEPPLTSAIYPSPSSAVDNV